MFFFVERTSSFFAVRMKVQFDLQMVPLVELASCREKKHQQIDREYEQKLREFRQALAEQETQISQTVSLVEDLVKENDASLDQVNQLRRTIHQLAKQVNQLLTRPVVDQEDLLGTTVLMAGQRYLVKARIKCQNTDLFALESERPFESYNGLCPKCGVAHVSMQPKRGFYALSSSLLCGFRS